MKFTMLKIVTKPFLVNLMFYQKDNTRKIKKFKGNIEISRNAQLLNTSQFQGHIGHYKIQTINIKKVPQQNRLI